MTANDFVKIVRSGGDKLRVDDVVINTGNQELHGKGMLTITRERIKVEVTVNPGETIPEFHLGIFTKRDHWSITGLIDDQLQFKSECASRAPGLVCRCNLYLHPIELIPSGWEAMTRTERDAFHKQHQQTEHIQQTVPAEVGSAEESDGDFSFYATLFEYPLLRTAPGNEVKGETECFEYVLTKDQDSSDLFVTLDSKKEHHSKDEQDHWRKFNAFMNALAFANGIHAWPYRIEYYRAGQKITDRITTAQKLGKTSHSPFSERLAFTAQIGEAQWSLQDTIRIASGFLSKNTTFNKEVAVILFLFREADDGVHSEITTIAVCALFENMVRLLFAELKPTLDVKNNELRLFEDAKSEICSQLALQIPEKGEGYRRMHKVIETAQAISMKQMFQATVTHLGLKWDGDMDKVYKTWSETRNRLVHGKLRANTTEDELKESIKHESIIAGAINILVLKMFGYTGPMRHSALEDGYRKI